MQIMPATARWVANRLGLKDWRPALDEALDANLNFGTYYMKEMLTKFDGSPVLASAAYNAGPRRAQEWRAPGALEAAIYIDTIPFNETRDYVRKVMANAAQYARVLGHPQDSLKARLGTIPARKGELKHRRRRTREPPVRHARVPVTFGLEGASSFGPHSRTASIPCTSAPSASSVAPALSAATWSTCSPPATCRCACPRATASARNRS